MCSGRVDLAFVLRAFSKGADGVFIGACHLNECNYVTHGNFHALSMVNICKKMMKYLGLNPDRLRLQFMSGSEANVFVESVNEFVKDVKDLGPLGQTEGIEKKTLKLKLETVNALIPYIRLVERERLRVPLESEEKSNAFFSSEEVNKVFNETIEEKLSIGQIILLLRDGPLSTGEISELLGLSPSEVSRHLITSSRHRLVRYDVNLKCYAVA
jgi:coenzyme F420-reducing hydrogenase delta subunit/predicted HTH domain antitoxin